MDIVFKYLQMITRNLNHTHVFFFLFGRFLSAAFFLHGGFMSGMFFARGVYVRGFFFVRLPVYGYRSCSNRPPSPTPATLHGRYQRDRNGNEYN